MNSFLFHHLGLWLQSSASQQVQLQAWTWHPSMGRQTMISSYNLPQQIFVSGLACAAELECRALRPVRLYCAGRAGPAIRFRPPKHEAPTASQCIVNSWYQWSPNSAIDAVKEIWAYSPIEWARWFAKNFATPKDIERTESWQHLRQVHSRLNIKIYEIWCLTMFYPDIIWHPPESCWISTKTQEKLIKLSDGENDGLLKSIAETQRADMLMGDSLADAFVQPVDCDLYVLGSDCDQIWPSESSLKYRSTANEGSWLLIWRVFLSVMGFVAIYVLFVVRILFRLYMFICYLAYLIIWFCKDIIPMKNINLDVTLGVFCGRPLTCSDVA